MCDLVPFVQFKKREKHPWRIVTFKSNTPPWVFFTFLKLYKWYQILKRISYLNDTHAGKPASDESKFHNSVEFQ